MPALVNQSSLRLLLLATILSTAVSACGSYRSPTASTAPQAPAAENSLAGASTDKAVDAGDQAEANPASTSTVPKQQPQLVKSGTLTLTVDSVGQAIEKVTAVARQQQGDLLGLQDQLPDAPGSRHTALLQIRVPQQNLEATIKELTQIGIVQQQSISAEDVSNQLVDYQARLRNLRKTETTLLEIMNRSGSIADVLQVAQELSNVRNSIEQIDAQLKDLQNRIAYSVLTINLQQATTTTPAQPGVQKQVQETWQQATHSVGGFTVGLMKLGLWLLAYSPYLVAVILGVVMIRRWRSHSRTVVPTPEPPTSS